jgi:hypothetical protein
MLAPLKGSQKIGGYFFKNIGHSLGEVGEYNGSMKQGDIE